MAYPLGGGRSIQLSYEGRWVKPISGSEFSRSAARLREGIDGERICDAGRDDSVREVAGDAVPVGRVVCDAAVVFDLRIDGEVSAV